jgi:hypothetical protein
VESAECMKMSNNEHNVREIRICFHPLLFGLDYILWSTFHLSNIDTCEPLETLLNWLKSCTWVLSHVFLCSHILVALCLSLSSCTDNSTSER